MTALQQLRRTWLAMLIALALALAGCSDDSGDSDNSDDTGDDPDDGTMPDDGTTPDDGMSPDPTPPAMPPMYINGTVSGVADCQLGENAMLPDTQTVPAEAINRTYEISVAGGTQAPAGFAICLTWSPGGETGNTGTVPAGASEVKVMVDGGEAIEYSIKIT